MQNFSPAFLYVLSADERRHAQIVSLPSLPIRVHLRLSADQILSASIRGSEHHPKRRADDAVHVIAAQ